MGYFEGDLGSKVTLFNNKPTPLGSTFTFEVNAGDRIGFFSGPAETENSLNGGQDRAVVYKTSNTCGEYVIAFENSSSSIRP